MALRGRVGRHTRLSGRECQNWVDDQRKVVDLLNRVAPELGGTGGVLKPRIVAGIASDSLYKAIVAFEDKHFPHQHSGFIEPNGPLYIKLLGLASTHTSATKPVASTSMPATSTNDRMLKESEKAILRPLFLDTFPYDEQQIGANTRELGGRTNSITLADVPRMAMSRWSFDYGSASDWDKWVFIHEMTHAWQWSHGRNNVLSAARLYLSCKDYESADDYNFDDAQSFFDFNFEQQASLVADYWYITRGKVPQNNKGMRADLATYER